MARPVRSMEERLANAIKNGAGRGAMSGLVDNARYRKGPRSGAKAGSGSGVNLTAGVKHRIDQFTITDDTVDAFTLTFLPQQDSWNVLLNAAGELDEIDFEIVGQTLTVLDPSDLFLGVGDDPDPWTLQVQYDYNAGLPGVPEGPAVFPRVATVGPTGDSTTSLSFPSPPLAGSSVLLFIIDRFGGPGASVSGLGATWTLLESAAAGSATELWVGVGCNGTGDTIDLSSGTAFWGASAVEVTTALTATGANTDDGVGASAGPVTASTRGVGVICADSSFTAAPTFLPSGSWTVVAAGDQTTGVKWWFYVQHVEPGTSLECTSVDLSAIVAAVHYS